ncbi:conserved hypothetical protein [Ricinus communis]|uniref:Uncharacterized protein n=1 Tax=Ricinus communis TaxID=3988 RepID=B9STM6_RICCO|nr:conserved hypothetical protein [Ricinus communis]
MRAQEDIIPSISPAMIDLQVLGYNLPLISECIGRTPLLAALLLTARLLIRLYDNMYKDSYSNSEYVSPGNASTKFNKISAAAIIVMLAAMLHIQQNWKTRKLSLSVISGRFKLKFSESKLHEK